MEEFKETQPECMSPEETAPATLPVLQRQDAIDVPKKRVLSDKQKENLALGRAIARKNREEKAKAKLDEMVDNYLKPFAEKKVEPEEVKVEPEESPAKKKRTKKNQLTISISPPKETQTSSEDFSLASSEESAGWLSPPSEEDKQNTWGKTLMSRAMNMPLPASTVVKKRRVAPVKFI